MNKPNDFPQERWDSLSTAGKGWWLGRIDTLGSYEAVVKWMEERSSRPRKTRLNDEQREAIRTSTKSNAQLAEQFNISASYASKIRNGHR